MNLQELKQKTPAALLEIAEELEIENASSLRKQDQMFTILKEKHSSFNDRNEIDGSKFLTRDYKPIVSNILNGDFSSKLYNIRLFTR